MSAVLARRAPYPVRAHQRRCEKCGKLVARSAYACRRCGKTQRIRPRVILLGLAACLMVAMFAAASASALLPAPRSAEALPPVAEAARPPVTAARAQEIGATELWMAYARDSAGADRRFLERSLVVTGTVRSVDRDYGGDLVVRLATGDSFDTVNATLATRNDPGIAALTKGRQVSLLCVGRGALMGAPRLASCYLRERS
jgi:hypothetical protein